MFAHVDKFESDAGGLERGGDDALGRPDEGVHGPIGRRPGVHVQQTDPAHCSDGIRYCIDHLSPMINDT